MPDVSTPIKYAWLTFGVVWLAAAFTPKRTVRRQSAGSRLTQLALGVIAGLLLWCDIPHMPFLRSQLVSPSPLTAGLAVALTFVGILIAFWARFFLGRNWSGTVTLKQDHELIQSGPYSVVRHPIYSGILLALFGTVLVHPRIGGFLAVLVAALTLRLKSLTEESFMIDRFGMQYLEYQRHVKALIPFVW